MSHWVMSDLLSRCSSLSCVTLERSEVKVKWLNDKTEIQIFTEVQWQNQTHSGACRPPLSLRTLYSSRERTRGHTWGSSVRSALNGVSVYADINTAASQIHAGASTKWKNGANSLVGLELQESLLHLSDLCSHALLGRRRLPENHSDAGCFSCCSSFNPTSFSYWR